MQRPKSFARHFFGLWGWLALCSVLVALVFGTIGHFGNRTETRLANAGADASATVIEKRRRRDSDGDTDYLVSYQFQVAGETIEGRQDVSYGFYNQVSEGDQLPVRYWTGDPSVSEIERGDAAMLATIGTIGAATGLAVAALFGRLAWRRAAGAQWMLRHGVRRQVTVTGHRQTNVRINDVQQWQALWREADGREGATRMADRDRLPKEGETIRIVVDPEHRRDSLWEGDLMS